MPPPTRGVVHREVGESVLSQGSESRVQSGTLWGSPQRPQAHRHPR